MINYRSARFIAVMIFLNVSFLLMLWMAIVERPERVQALIAVLTIQVLLNAVSVFGFRRFRSKVSGLTLVYVCGLIYGVIQAITVISGGSFVSSRLR
jgi:hypothetical protein